jgi:hypothetical protein
VHSSLLTDCNSTGPPRAGDTLAPPEEGVDLVLAHTIGERPELREQPDLSAPPPGHAAESQIGTVRGRHARTQYATMSLVSVKAVNKLVRMPMPSVMAKPRTGPLPT